MLPRHPMYIPTHRHDAAGKEWRGREGKGEDRLVEDHARSKCKCALRVVANVSNAYAVLRRRPPDGAGPDERGPLVGPGIISTRIIIDDHRYGGPRGARSVTFRCNPIASGWLSGGGGDGRGGK